jgi:hypothetical protein
MSVYRQKGSPFYQFDFQWRGRRFHGTTKQTSRREAERVERDERERAKRLEAQAKASHASLQLDHIAVAIGKKSANIMPGLTTHGAILSVSSITSEP